MLTDLADRTCFEAVTCRIEGSTVFVTSVWHVVLDATIPHIVTCSSWLQYELVDVMEVGANT